MKSTRKSRRRRSEPKIELGPLGLECAGLGEMRIVRACTEPNADPLARLHGTDILNELKFLRTLPPNMRQALRICGLTTLSEEEIAKTWQ